MVLAISAILQYTYKRLQKLFVTKGREAQAQLVAENYFSQWLMAAVEKNKEGIPKMCVTHCDRRLRFLSLRGWSQGLFRVRLMAGICDCGIFQSLHFPYCYALAACAVTNEVLWPGWYGTWLHPNPSCIGRLLKDLCPIGFGMTWMRASARRRGVVYTGKSGILGEVVPTNPRTKLRWLFPFLRTNFSTEHH
ncbi:hypothetical protein Ahy_A03g013871 [Arachis hypogaea]|uniref:Uncharacterized protein n=1 Tax=Arachis hypogaea TaxID=3818 RepID=A0A445DWD1_ARAHY|nr:hypothetical protein Ahy_A03g013871 [Arachis hypogaea]